MHILEHAPVTFLGGLGKHNVSVLFLTLSHGNVGEGTSFDGFVVCETNLLDIWSWVDSWEKHKEGWNVWLGLLVDFEDIEGWLFDVLQTEPFSDVLYEGTSKSVWSHSSQEQESVEESAVLESSWQFNGLSLLIHVPLTPLKGLAFH